MQIFVLLSTIDNGICRTPNVLCPAEDGVTYVVVWQQTKAKEALGTSWTIATRILAQRRDVILEEMSGRGLCRSRNRAMEIAIEALDDPLEDAIFVLADDDERFDSKAFDNIRAVYEQYERLDFALLRMRSNADGRYLKRYPKEAVSYRRRPAYYYPSSLEMTFRSRLFHSGLRFDERFGLGSEHLCGGEEEIFLFEAQRKGLNGLIVPKDICRTEATTTGSTLTPALLRTKGAVFAYQLSRPKAWLRCWREAISLGIRRKESPLKLFRILIEGAKLIHL